MLTAGITLFVVSSVAPLLPQQEGATAALQKDAQFALALTRQLGFDNFSEIVLNEALTRAQSSEDRSALLLARCEVMSTVAGRPIEAAAQVEGWKSAANAYGEFLASSPPAEQARRAQGQLGMCGFRYGERLLAHLESGSVSSDERTELLAEAETVFTDSLKATNSLISWWNGLDDPEVRDSTQFSTYFPASFYRALVYYYWGMVYPAGSIEREDNVGQSVAFLEEFAIEAGESTPAGLLAFKHMADGLVALNDPEFAIELYDFIIENGVLQEDVDAGMPAAEIKRRQDVQQDAFLGKMRLFMASGDANSAIAFGATFTTWAEENRVQLNDSGYRVLLEVAAGRIDAGDFAGAIEIAQQVGSENEGKLMRLEADKLLSLAIASAPATTRIDLGVLFSAGEGAFYAKNYGDAVRNLRLLVGRLTSGGQTAEYGPRAYYFLGRALEADSLPLEAAVAYQEGYTRFPDDEETAPRIASNWQRLADRFRTSDPSDAFLEKFYNDALNAVSATSGDAAPHALFLRSADRDYATARGLARQARNKPASSPEAQAALTAFEKAIAAYKRVDAGTESYEKAFVQIGMCEFHSYAFDNSSAQRAVAIFNEYLNEIVLDPNKVPATPKGKKYRVDSIARADFYRGRMYRNMAAAGDLAAWDSMLEAFDGFEDRQPEQADQIGAVRTYRAEALIATGDPEGAAAQYELLVADNAAPQWLSSCAYQIFAYYNTQASTLDDPEERTAAQKEAVKYLAVVNTQSSSPRWENLLKEAKLHFAVGDVASGTRVLESTLERFSEAQGFTGSSRLYAELDLVDAYLEQGRTGEALPYVDQLLAEKPNMLRVKQMAIKIKCGFPVIREGRVQQVPGEDTVEAYKVADGLVKDLMSLADSKARKAGLTKFESEEWWQARLQYTYLLYKWSIKDSSKSHKDSIEKLQRQAPDFGASIIDNRDIPFLFNWLNSQG